MLDRSGTFRVLASLIADELCRLGKPAADALRWCEQTPLGAAPTGHTGSPAAIAVDSIDLLALASRVSGFFHVFESGIDDALLMHRTLGQWLDIIAQSQQDADSTGDLTFRTSGSGGLPKAVMHRRADVLAEAVALRSLLSGLAGGFELERIVSVVPTHHLYGFMWTAALPKLMGLDVVSLSTGSGGPRKLLRPGDLLVSHPAWYATAGCNLRSLRGVVAVSSAGKLSTEIAERLMAHGAKAVLDVYGSTETGGIAVRTFPDVRHRLLEHWRRGADAQSLVRVAGDGMNGGAVPCADELRWHDEREFELGGRLDGAVKIAGINVFPQHVASVICEHPGVERCAVRPSAGGQAGDVTRLKAFVVPREQGVLAARAGLDALQLEIDEFVSGKLTAAQRPTRYDFGRELPTGAMGKHGDW